MKYFYLLLISLGFCFSACKKNNEEVIVNDGLIGRWQLVRSGIGIGGGGTMNNADPSKPEIIEFKKDSNFTANVNSYFLKSYNTYGIINSRDLKFFPDLPSGPPNRWGYKTSDGTGLTLYMSCIEGCIFEYKAIR